jgi:phage-related tail protein
MVQRMQAINAAVQTVKPALQAFYSSLSDEQKARFNEIGMQLGQPRQQRNASSDAKAVTANCSTEKAGISNLAINRVEETVRPTEAQGALLDKLDDAMGKAVETLRGTCPSTVPQTPVGRLDVIQKRLQAMIDAANTIRPALDEFYASLNDEQKAKFNRLGRETAQGG